MPLQVEVFRTRDEIRVRLTNVSTKHLAITKRPHSWSSVYERADGSKLAEGGAAIPAIPTEFLDLKGRIRPRSAHLSADGGADGGSLPA